MRIRKLLILALFSFFQNYEGSLQAQQNSGGKENIRIVPIAYYSPENFFASIRTSFGSPYEYLEVDKEQNTISYYNGKVSGIVNIGRYKGYQNIRETAFATDSLFVLRMIDKNGMQSHQFPYIDYYGKIEHGTILFSTKRFPLHFMSFQELMTRMFGSIEHFKNEYLRHARECLDRMKVVPPGADNGELNEYSMDMVDIVAFLENDPYLYSIYNNNDIDGITDMFLEILTLEISISDRRRTSLKNKMIKLLKKNHSTNYWSILHCRERKLIVAGTDVSEVVRDYLGQVQYDAYLSNGLWFYGNRRHDYLQRLLWDCYYDNINFLPEEESIKDIAHIIFSDAMTREQKAGYFKKRKIREPRIR